MHLVKTKFFTLFRPPFRGRFRRMQNDISRGCLGELVHGALRLVGIAVLALACILAVSLFTARDKPARPRPMPARETASKPAPSPASRSAWRTETYTGANGARLPMLVADDILGTGCMVVRDPAGACLVEIQAPASMPVDGPEKWRTPIMDGKRRIIETGWVRQDARRAMLELTDAAGQFDPKRGRAVLDALLADGAETIVVPYPRAGGALHGLSISLDGLADALAATRGPVADL